MAWAPLAGAEAGSQIEPPRTVATAADVVRLAPPLILTEQQAATFVTALPAILDAASPQESTS